VTRPLPDDVVAAYDAPFPDDSYKAGARQFPMLVPTAPQRSRRARQPAAVDGPRAVGQAVPVRLQRRRRHHARRRPYFLERVPGTKGQPHVTIEGGGHFLQEDRGEELAAAIIVPGALSGGVHSMASIRPHAERRLSTSRHRAGEPQPRRPGPSDAARDGGCAARPRHESERHLGEAEARARRRG
jgi:hypothetical protein